MTDGLISEEALTVNGFSCCQEFERPTSNVEHRILNEEKTEE
jgi:hypothetical protein